MLLSRIGRKVENVHSGSHAYIPVHHIRNEKQKAIADVPVIGFEFRELIQLNANVPSVTFCPHLYEME